MALNWKRIGCITSTILIVLLILLGVSSQYFLHYALGRDTADYDPRKQLELSKTEYPWQSRWIDSLLEADALRDTSIINQRGNRLHAWYVAAPHATGNTAVLVHGYKSHPMSMMMLGYLYHHCLQWNILLPDQEAHAQSEGEWIQMGWLDRQNMQQWVRVAHAMFQADTMVVHGVSMGAATAMCLAGDPTPDYVRAFVEDCGYTSVWDEFRGELKAQFGLPAFPLLHFTSLSCKLQHGWSFREANPLRQVAKCQKPMLFIHGDADTYVPTWMVRPLYEAKSGKKRLWLAPGSEHANAYKDHPEEYTKEVADFLSHL